MDYNSLLKRGFAELGTFQVPVGCYSGIFLFDMARLALVSGYRNIAKKNSGFLGMVSVGRKFWKKNL